MSQITTTRGPKNVGLLSVGAYRPDRVVSNDEICQNIDSSDEWIYSRTGIKTRRFAADDESAIAGLPHEDARGPVIINEGTRDRMRTMLADIRTGVFAREWILENQANRPVFNALQRQGKEHQIEVVGKKLRDMMSWIGEGGFDLDV